MKKRLFQGMVTVAFALFLVACGGTGSPANDPYHIGTVYGVEVRISGSATRQDGYIALEVLRKMETARVNAMRTQGGITIIEITGSGRNLLIKL